MIGGDLWALSNEIDKLLTFSPDRKISVESIGQNTGYVRDVKIFDLVDAILAHNTLKAQQQLHRSFDEGMAPIYVLTMITRQFRLILRAKEMLMQKISPSQIGSELNLRHQFALQKTIDQSKGYSLPRLNDIYHRLLDTDIALKTSRYTENLAMELLVTELCRK
jgi:DNA polymerase-3 subunit delta